MTLKWNLYEFAFSCVKTKTNSKAFDDFKNKQKSVWSNVFWYVKVCVFQKCIQYTIYWDKTQMLKKFPSEKVSGTKNAMLFLSRAPTRHNFTFNSQFLFELKYKVCLSKILYGIFHFRFRFIFIKDFCSTKFMNSLTFRTKITEKPQTVLLPEQWFLSCNKKFFATKLEEIFENQKT